LLALSFLAGCGGGKQVDVASSEERAKPQVTSSQTRVLAVLPFDVVGKSKLSGEEAMNLLIAELMDMEGFKVVDREALQDVLDQLGFGMSELTERSNRMKVGSMLGAKFLCIGSINKEFRLATARINSTETGEVLLVVKARNKDELEYIDEIAQKLKDGLKSPRLAASLEVTPEKPVKEDSVSPPVAVEVKGYGAISWRGN
jgi:TolB-like protein